MASLEYCKNKIDDFIDSQNKKDFVSPFRFLKAALGKDYKDCFSILRQNYKENFTSFVNSQYLRYKANFKSKSDFSTATKADINNK